MNSILACAACFGKSDSNLAQGMNWGIFCLLVVVVGVLATLSAFFIFLAKRAAMAQTLEPVPGTTAASTPNL
jgi:hypothetical protein